MWRVIIVFRDGKVTIDYDAHTATEVAIIVQEAILKHGDMVVHISIDPR